MRRPCCLAAGCRSFRLADLPSGRLVVVPSRRLSHRVTPPSLSFLHVCFLPGVHQVRGGGCTVCGGSRSPVQQPTPPPSAVLHAKHAARRAPWPPLPTDCFPAPGASAAAVAATISGRDRSRAAVQEASIACRGCWSAAAIRGRSTSRSRPAAAAPATAMPSAPCAPRSPTPRRSDPGSASCHPHDLLAWPAPRTRPTPRRRTNSAASPGRNRR
jgi:hypothetical protein